MKTISVQKPLSMLEGKGPYTAYYLENREQYLYALFKRCVAKGLHISNWQPYYQSDRDDFEKFKKEYSHQWSIVTGMPDNIAYNKDVEVKPDWYIFQYYETHGSYYSDKYEQEMNYTDGHFHVTSLSAVRADMEKFFALFDNYCELPDRK